MSIRAFVLTQTEAQKTQDVLGRLDKPVTPTFGRWDTVSIVESETPQALCEHVVGHVRKLEGVIRTETLPIHTSTEKTGAPTFPVTAQVFLKTEANRTNEVFGRLASLNEALAVHTVAGRYDIIAKFGANTWDELSERILNGIRPIEGITSTETALTIG